MIELRKHQIYSYELNKLSFEYQLFPSISAGFPSPADDFLEKSLSLDELIIKNPSSTFFVKVVGNSMIGAGIYPNDILVVDRSLSPSNNDVIVAYLSGDFTVKRFVKDRNRCMLQAENPAYSNIIVDEHSDFRVWGVVTQVIHKPYPLK